MGKMKLMKGNEAIAIGALNAGLVAYYGYPITPASEVAETLAIEFESGEWEDYKVYMQASSEIEAANMVLGSASTGVKTMTFTASPGFSLKQEAISYGVGMEIPFIIGNVNRGGPGLGNLGAEQSDYWQVTRGGGHGGYRLTCYAPSSVQEILSFPKLAFDTAFKYRQPVLIVSDAFTGQVKADVELGLDVTDGLSKGAGGLEDLESHWNFESTAEDWAVGHRDTRSGGARRIINSLHLENEIHTIHSAGLNDRWRAIEQREALWETVGGDDAEVLLVAYGIPSRICRAAVTKLRADGLNVGLLRPATLFPFPSRALANLAPQLKECIVVELNHGQMIHDVKAAVHSANNSVKISGINYTGGLMPSVKEIIQKAKNALKSGGE